MTGPLGDVDLTVENISAYEPVHNVNANGIVTASQFGSVNVKGNVRIGDRLPA